MILVSIVIPGLDLESIPDGGGAGTLSTLGDINAAPICEYSCIIIMASRRWGSEGPAVGSNCGPEAPGFTSCAQNARIEAGDEMSHSSANISSFFVVSRMTGMTS